MFKSKLLAALTVGALVVAGAMVSTTAIARDDKGGKTAAAASEGAVTVGSVAPDFKLTDTDGKEHTLASHKGKIVVLEWFNPECPFVLKHHKANPTFANLHKEFGDKVVFLAINSSAKGKQGHGLELNKEKKTEFKIEYPILIDEDGKVGKAYGAKRTPELFVIGTDGKVAYHGAIDNDSSRGKVGKTNYVADALNALLAGKPIEKTKTDAYGCTVKYAD